MTLSATTIMMLLTLVNLISLAIALGLTVATVWQVNVLAGQAALAWAVFYLMKKMGITSLLLLALEKPKDG